MAWERLLSGNRESPVTAVITGLRALFRDSGNGLDKRLSGLV